MVFRLLHGRYELFFNLMFTLMLLLPGLLFAGGRQELETRVLLTQAPRYISPGNPETGKDVLTIENIRLEIQDSAAIRRYELKIFNRSGEEIYSVAEENLEGRGFVAELLNVGDIPSVTLPESMVWDGRDNTAAIVPDGEYFYQLYVRDSFDKTSSTPPLSVVVDTRAPEIFGFSSDLRVFSPNGDGRRDLIRFSARTGPAETWSYTVFDGGGSIVASLEEQSSGTGAADDILAPPEFIWDGKTSDGESAVEGSYQIILEGVDRAGNRTREEISFELNNSLADVELAIEGNNPWFSPDVRGEMIFLVSLSDARGLDSWQFVIVDEDGIVHRRVEGDSADLPGSIVFDGRGNPGRPESPSFPMEDGSYRARFTAFYENGNSSASGDLVIHLDTLPPVARLGADSAPLGRELGDPIYFGGERRPYLALTGELEEGVDWELVLVDPSGAETRIPYSRLVEAGAGLPLNWDGRDPLTGGMLPDGAWQLYFQGEDRAGNRGSSVVARFIKDTADRSGTAVQLSATLLAPGGDAGHEVVRITPRLSVEEGLEYMILSIIQSDDGRTYFTRESFTPISYLEWTGVRNNDAPAPDGDYYAELYAVYYNGDSSRVRSETISLGRARPEAFVDAEIRLFSPNGDGERDSILIEQETDEQELWTGSFIDSQGRVVRSLEWQGRAESFSWDGRDDEGELLTDGYYRYRLEAVNRFGNIGGASLENLRIDNLSATISIGSNEQVFSPNNDGFRDSVTILPKVAVPENLNAWKITLSTRDGLIQKTFQGGSSLPERILWDGRNDALTVLDGEYHLSFEVEYRNGSVTRREADEAIVLVTNPPRGRLVLSAEPFSPDGDGVEDRRIIGLDARGADRPVEGWEVEILDPYGNSFRNWTGEGLPPAELVWDGLSDTGELVQSAADYTVLFTLEDNLKNRGVVSGIIPVDILIIADGNRLRINIPSIHFAGYTADLFAVEPQEQARNFDTLRRLAEILNRYQDYSISIEGHAVQLLTGAAGRREQQEVLIPLSRDRAQEVRQALAILGVDWERMSVRGLGGANPLVAHSDEDNRWKNRRVEFILER